VVGTSGPSRKVTQMASGPATATTSLPEKVQPARKKAPATLVSSLANSTPTVMEGNAPAWFSDSLAMLQSSEIPLGEGWAELVRLWVAFEEKEGFKERRKLSAKDRPECITDWVRRARSPTWRPVITNVGAFGKVFHA